MEVEVRVPPLGIHLDSIQAQFRVRLEESEVAGIIKEAVEKVEKSIGAAGGNGGGRRRGRTRGRNQGRSRSETRLVEAGNAGERGRASGEDRISEEDSLQRRATRGSTQEDPLSPHQSKLS